ncbi:Neprilysin-21 [Orchesella cincta]|uniref:Neprilysin-21 n=1 Tax=Orchesella cincta TaxID=48709 RepID=A0A1D2MQD2_ORCCI|nr:Neprilysin-21 [Orchesella cincta]
MKSYIDQSIDPCENFYAFACGGFIQNTKVPKDKMEVTQFSILEDKVLANLKLLFEEPIFPQETYPFSVAKTLYKSCMDLERLESLGFSPLLNILEGIGSWPVLLGNDWKPHLHNWTDAIWLKMLA